MAAKDALMDFDEALERFEPVLGFEVHVELATATKMFSDAPNFFGGEPNTNVTPVDLGLPGSLPVVNEQAVRFSVSLGLALGCSIAESSRFSRKNYFYPDNPKNYQISQYDEPIAYEGEVEVELADGTLFQIPIERAHMEEDAGKLTHVGGATGRIQGAEYSLVDYNRAGVPLVEIVTKPIVGAAHRAPELGAAYVQVIRDLVRALGVSEARMERGNLRCDANISLRPWGQEKLGTRTETKNVNSFRAVERAIRYEIQRQAAILADGGTITQETRHWHEDTGRTSAGRPKSDADDYRYFPEPDLLPVVPDPAMIEELRAALPEAPVARRGPGVPGRRQRRTARRGRGHHRRRRRTAGRAQVVDRRDQPRRQLPGHHPRRAGVARARRGAHHPRRVRRADRPSGTPGARGRHRR
jgi:aspartyl-tRNA(Asn)/glutamyl-tRNA(Gln) amidotransferase subunit B